MKKKVFFVLSSLTSGGAEKVFWLLSQNFDKSLYDVTLVLLTSKRNFFSTKLYGVKIIDLNTEKASLSFFKFFKLLREEKPHAIFCTGGQINALMGFTSFFINLPNLIARPANVADIKVSTLKGKFLNYLLNVFYRRFDIIVCQSHEIKQSLLKKYNLHLDRLVTIPNPVVRPGVEKKTGRRNAEKKLIIVGRLAKQKGHDRFLEVFRRLPENYSLTIVGDGPLKEEIIKKINSLNLSHRVHMAGRVKAVTELVATHDLFVLPSYFEGFPNAVVESLSVGTPVVAFKVGGITEIIKPDFNGYILEQDDIEGFKRAIINGCEKTWDLVSIKDDIIHRFSIEAVTYRYQQLIA